MFYSILKTQSDLRHGHAQRHSYQTDVPSLDGSIVRVYALRTMLKITMSKFKEASKRSKFPLSLANVSMRASSLHTSHGSHGDNLCNLNQSLFTRLSDVDLATNVKTATVINHYLDLAVNQFYEHNSSMHKIMSVKR